MTHFPFIYLSSLAVLQNGCIVVQCELGMLRNVASTVSNVVDLGRPEVAAACSFAAMVGGNMDDVRDITCKMIDQVIPYCNSPCSPIVLNSCHG